MELKLEEFEKIVWEKVDYFKTIYIQDDTFFTPKFIQQKIRDQFYIEYSALKKWANLISLAYDPWNNDKNQLIKDLLQNRKGQYSNGTLYSSSRLIAEIFYKNENRCKILKWLELDKKYKPEDFKWTLEYRLPIFHEDEKYPAQLDLVIENDAYFIGVESKMREIYTKNFNNDFELSYIDLLKEFESDLKINKAIVKKNKKEKEVYRVCVDGLTNNNFYFKQQICHLFGMRRKQKVMPNKKIIFLNFVFDVSAIPCLDNMNGANIRYKENEEKVMKILKKYFEKSNIEYKGLLSHDVLLKVK